MSEIIGFIGVEKYDLILYLSSLLSKMSYKVLIIDYSETDALTCCIPIPSALNPKVSKVTFGNIDFLKENSPMNYINDYDYIMVDYGLKTLNKDISGCNKLFIVTDKQKHNIERINNIKTSIQDVFLILKDLNWKDKADVILQSVVLPIKETYIHNYDETDRAYMIELQYDEKIKLKKLSPDYKSIIQKIITEVFEKEQKQYGIAYAMLKKGA